MIAIEIFEIHTQFFCTHDMNTNKYQTINTYRCSLLFHFRKCVNSCSFNLENDTINVFVELPILPLKSKEIRRGARGPPAPLDPLLNVERCDDRMSSLLLIFTSLLWCTMMSGSHSYYRDFLDVLPYHDRGLLRVGRMIHQSFVDAMVLTHHRLLNGRVQCCHRTKGLLRSFRYVDVEGL